MHIRRNNNVGVVVHVHFAHASTILSFRIMIVLFSNNVFIGSISKN
jgi:hypothetical protein